MKFSVKNKVDFSTRAASGIEKIELMLQKRKIYHIIFLKLNLPKKNGFEVNLWQKFRCYKKLGNLNSSTIYQNNI